MSKEVLRLALEALETLKRQEFAYKTPSDVLYCLNSITAIKEALAQPEPLALQYPQKDIDWQREQQIKAQASIPPQRTWVGLTDDEICNLEGFYDFMTKKEFFDAIRKVEAKLKDKNDPIQQ